MAVNYIDKWNANGQMYDIQDAGRGLPNGVATLDLDGRVPYSQLPESAVEFKGYWNAATNTPTLADGTGTKGDMYYVSVAGTRDLGSGTQRFYVGDRVLYDGSVWKNMNPDLIDLFLPVGHLIWTSNANFNPNTQYPGTTWTQIKDRFVLAAGETYTNGATGGASTVALTMSQMPRHTHSAGHGHSASCSSAGDHFHGYVNSVPTATENFYSNTSGGLGGLGYVNEGVQTGSAGSHSHTITVDFISMDTGYAGGNSSLNTDAHENMPPYVVKYCWERTA